MRASSLTAPIVGHVGDGNFHVLFAIDPRDAGEMAEAERLNASLVHRALAMGGTCTGEHVVDPDQLHLTLQQLVQGWAHAWSSQDVAGYLDYYASEFKPDNSELSRQQWEELRQSRLITPSHITLSLADLALIEFEKPVKEVVFRQSYSSNIYSDVIVKSIKFIDQDGEWKILGEKTVRVIN